jgi:pilus assembly protein CpaC
VATNEIQTQVTIKNGESAALGGSAFDNALSNYNKPRQQQQGNQNPGSPLFNMVRSKSFNRDKSQFIIFVTPEVIRTASSATEDMTRKFRLNAGEK